MRNDDSEIVRRLASQPNDGAGKSQTGDHTMQ